MSHLSSLLTVRRRSLSRRLSQYGMWAWCAAAVAFGAVIGVGYGLIDALATGETALETAFWLTCAAASMTSFHCMDLMFRVPDVRALDHLPVDLGDFFWDRLVAVVGDALIYALPIASLFLPLGLLRSDAAAVVGIGLPIVGLPLAGAASMVAYLYLGVRVTGGRLVSKTDDSSRSGETTIDADMYGGPGGMLLYAPGIALSCAVVGIVGVRLVFRETIRPDAPIDVISALWIVGLVVACGLIAYARRAFVRDYIPIRARFREADAMSFDVDLDYQESVFDVAVWGERWAPPVARPLVRAYALQYHRRHLLVRYAFPAAGIAAAVATLRLDAAAFPLWVSASIPAVLLGTFASPWQRLNDAAFRPNVLDALPIDDIDTGSALTIQAAREVSSCVLWYTALTGTAILITDGPTSTGLFALCVVGSAAVVTASVTLSRHLLAGAASAVAPAAAALAVGVAYSSIWIPAVAGGLALGATLVSAYRYPSDETRSHAQT